MGYRGFLGITGGPLALADITGSAFEVEFEFLAKQASQSDSAYVPISNFYTNSNGGSQGQDLVTSIGGQFYSVAAAAPEPSTWAMMLLGFVGVGFSAYRKRSRSGPILRLI